MWERHKKKENGIKGNLRTLMESTKHTLDKISYSWMNEQSKNIDSVLPWIVLLHRWKSLATYSIENKEDGLNETEEW